MAVHQETGLPSVSLPNGANSLPLSLLRFFERFERIYLWLDADEVGINATQKFANVRSFYTYNRFRNSGNTRLSLLIHVLWTRMVLKTLMRLCYAEWTYAISSENARRLLAIEICLWSATSKTKSFTGSSTNSKSWAFHPLASNSTTRWSKDCAKESLLSSLVPVDRERQPF